LANQTKTNINIRDIIMHNCGKQHSTGL